METKETKRRRTQLARKSSQKVDKILKGGKMTKATTKTEEKFLTSKDLAKMANVKPGQLRRCLRKHFAGRLATIKGDSGLKVYQVKADDPIVKEIIAKLSGNGDKGKGTKLLEVKTPKLTKEAKKQAKVKAKQEAAHGEIAQASGEVTDPDEQADKGEGEEPSPESITEVTDEGLIITESRLTVPEPIKRALARQGKEVKL